MTIVMMMIVMMMKIISNYLIKKDIFYENISFFILFFKKSEKFNINLIPIKYNSKTIGILPLKGESNIPKDQ